MGAQVLPFGDREKGNVDLRLMLESFAFSKLREQIHNILLRK